jgi:hemerythrin superfamily protein
VGAQVTGARDASLLQKQEATMPNRMDSMLSHGMGKLKGAKARISGLVGVFKTLAEQHGEVTALLERAKSSDAKFTQLWPTIRRELLSHEQAEVRELYPLLRVHAETVPLADRHDAEAHQMEELITSIDGLAIGSSERRAVFQRLIDLVVQHARDEETKIFPKAQEVLGKDRAISLEATFLAAKEQLAKAL